MGNRVAVGERSLAGLCALVEQPGKTLGQQLHFDVTLESPVSIRSFQPSEVGLCEQPAVVDGENGLLTTWAHVRYGTSYQDIHGVLMNAGLFSDGFESGDLTQWSSSTW
jgi:hypothetical protein